MKHHAVWIGSALLIWSTGVAAAPAFDRSADDPVVYEVTEVDGKLVRLHPTSEDERASEERVAGGDRLAGGAELRTGWFSSADLAVPRAAARFHLRSRTHARLGADEPGVLLVLDKGRLRALFDELGEMLGGEADAEPERRIETPSAILAVRGTEYGVAVGRDGTTTLVVFEGVVEVFTLPDGVGPEGRIGPVRVRAGHALHVRRGHPPSPPRPHGMTPRGWDRGATPPMGPPPVSPGQHGPPATAPGEGPQKGPPDTGAGPHGNAPATAGKQQQGPPPGG